MTPWDEVSTLRHQLVAVQSMLDGIDARINNLTDVACNVRAITQATAEIFGVTPDELTNSSRRAGIMEARFAAYWVARQATSTSLPQIGRWMGKRDHTTIMHGIARAEQMRAADVSYRKVTDMLLAHVRKVDAHA